MTSDPQEKAPLTEALKKFLEIRPVYFCIPGHRFHKGIPEDLLEACRGNIINFDFTESYGLDDLHNADGVIKEAQELTAACFGAEYSRFLVNGTTCGIEAAVSAAAGPGEKILVSRNAHRSVLGGMTICGAEPVWILPEYNEVFGFPESVSPDAVEQALRQEPDIKAVLLVSPTYYGSFCDIRTIAEICHSYQVPLIVDEAHGAYLYFSGSRGTCALREGADVSVMSAHKTMGAFGQSSWLHVNSSLISMERIDSLLKILMTSSPSYMLMASLDSARRAAALNGERAYRKAEDTAFLIRTEAEKTGYSCLGGSDRETFEYSRYDPARVVISAENAGLSGTELQDILFERFSIAVEMADLNNIVLVVTESNTEEDARRLTAALEELAVPEAAPVRKKKPDIVRFFSYIPEKRTSPRNAFFAGHRDVPLSEAAGRTAGDGIAIYPPGSLLVCPGEKLDQTIIEYIRKCLDAGLTLQNGSGHKLTDITVTAE